MNNVILSPKYPQFGAALTQRGYHVIPSQSIDRLIPYERDHADMQCLIIEDTAFVLSCCEGLIKELSRYYRVTICDEPISGKYPDNVRLNALILKKALIGRIRSLDEKVKNYCLDHGYKLINVNQGYTRCSCAPVNDCAVITADKGVYNSLIESNIDVLLIEQGRVRLEGAEYGFIGGASGADIDDSGRKLLYFSGDIGTHPDHHRISDFCRRHDTDIINLSGDELTDIGGMIFC